MTSTRERQQRAAARAKLAREMAERQTAARRRRQRQAGVGAAAALLVVIGGVVWAVTALSGDDEPDTPPAAAAGGEPADPSGTADPDGAAGSDGCEWLAEDAEANPNLRDVGTPPADVPREGVSTMTITTNHGVVEAELDTAEVPCTAASFAHLASQEFYDGSPCHRLVTEGIYVLQCGDPTGTGSGGPTYKYAEENLPVDESPPYPKGVIAMAKTQAPSSTGSQFFIVYEDTELPPDYTLVGTVTEGMDIVEQIAEAGHDDAYAEQAGGGQPNEEVIIETLRVSDPA